MEKALSEKMYSNLPRFFFRKSSQRRDGEFEIPSGSFSQLPRESVKLSLLRWSSSRSERSNCANTYEKSYLNENPFNFFMIWKNERKKLCINDFLMHESLMAF